MDVTPDELAAAIMAELEAYTDEAIAGVKKAVDDVAKEARAEIKKHAEFGGTGEYVKAFRVKTTMEDRTSKVKTWYVAAPHYRLAHLLEHGHIVVRDGRAVGRAKAYPHIKYGAELVERELPKRIEEVLGGDTASD